MYPGARVRRPGPTDNVDRRMTPEHGVAEGRCAMRRRHVVVLFQHRLFGEAVAQALSENDCLQVRTLPVDDVSPEALRAMHPDAIVLEEHRIVGDIKASLLDVDPMLTVVVGPETNTAQVYERHEVIEATVAEITARIMAGPRPAATRRLTTARSPTAVSVEDEP